MTPPAWAKPLAAGLHSLSLWFSANAVGDDLLRAWQLIPADPGRLTNAGFVLFSR